MNSRRLAGRVAAVLVWLGAQYLGGRLYALGRSQQHRRDVAALTAALDALEARAPDLFDRTTT